MIPPPWAGIGRASHLHVHLLGPARSGAPWGGVVAMWWSWCHPGGRAAVQTTLPQWSSRKPKGLPNAERSSNKTIG